MSGVSGFRQGLAALALVTGALGGIGAASAPAMAQAAARDAAAENFVGSNANHVLGILNDRRQGAEARRTAFHAAIGELVDWPRVTRFVLGKYARTATPDQMARFTAAYRAYAEGVYQHRIEDYKGDKAVVTTSTTRRPGDVIVVTNVSGRAGEPPVDLAWRVLAGPGGWKLVDVQVKGIWLAITQQQDFTTTIDNAGGKVDVLINQLTQDAARAR